MPKYLLRVEATNFAWFCYDTQDLSTIRGGSLLLADAHTLLAGIGAPKVHGASQAIWEFDLPNDDAAEAKRREIEFALTKHKVLKHATFSVDFVEATSDSPRDVQQLRTENRWRQFQRPTLAVPEPVERPERSAHLYCELDNVRPCADIVQKGTDRYAVSASVLARRDHGRDEKQKFYEKTVPSIKGRLPRFANELSEITSRKDWFEDDAHKNLENKMAVLYLDGNMQSEMAAKLGLDQLADFREYTRRRQAEFLQAVLEKIAPTQPEQEKSNDWYHWHRERKEHLVRFETLLWGGDDIVLVVPAWQGWQLARDFFDHVTGKIGEGRWEFQGTDFTYAAGLVLCSHKANIHRMRNLADDLFVQGKKATKNGKHENWLGYEVLESFDVAAADLEVWRAERLCSDATTKLKIAAWLKDHGSPDEAKRFLASLRLLLRPGKPIKPDQPDKPDKLDEIDEIEAVTAMLKAVHAEVENPEKNVSRRQIERLARDMRNHPLDDKNFNNEIVNYLNEVPAFKDCGDLSTRHKLYHLAALWDYVA